MGFGAVFSTLAFLLIFAGMVVLVINTQQTITASATEMRQQQERLADLSQQDITITNTQLQGPTELPWTIRYQDEFAQGTFANTQSQADRVTLDGATTGTYTSAAYNTGHQSNYTTLTWSAIIPSGATLEFQLRSADTLTALDTAPFIGPDGTTTTAYNTSGTPVHENHNEHQYIQWRATLQATTDAPQLISATLGVIRDAAHATITLTNNGNTKLRFEETDAYINGQRIPRSDAHRVIEYDNSFQDARLWNSAQDIAYTVFDTGTITLRNQRAQTTTTI